MTGATGSLTPDQADAEFVPAETREISDPATARDLTDAAHRRAAIRREDEPDEPGRLIERGERTAPNDRDGGYGSEHGLAADDPAYRMEESAGASGQGEPAARRPVRRPRLGGDELHRPEEEHF